MRRTWAVVLGLITACSPPVDMDAARGALVRADEAYTQAMDTGDVEGIVALYASEAVRYPPDGDPAGGPEAIRSFAERVAGTPGFGVRSWPLALELSDDGALGFTVNHLEVTFDGADGAPMVEWLRDAHLWRRVDGGAWRIVEDIWHVMEAPPSVMSLLSAPDVEVTSLGFVDLMGEPVDFDWEMAGTLPTRPPEGAQVPVEFLIVRWDGGGEATSTRLVVASADTRSPTFLMDEVVQYYDPEGGGFAPLDPLRLESDGEGEPLVLVVSQGGSPGNDGVMPGAPSLLRWRLVDGVFEIVEG